MTTTFRKWLLLGIGLPMLILGLLAAAALIFANTQWGHGWLTSRMQQELESALGADLTVQSLGGNLLYRVEAIGVRVAKQGRVVFRAERLEASYNLLAIIGGALRFGDVKVTGAEVDLAHLPLSGGGGGGVNLSIRRLDITRADIKPGGLLGPVTGIKGLSVKGRLEVGHRGPDFRGELGVEALTLEGLDRPLGIKASAEYEDDDLRLTRLEVACGPNQVLVSGVFSLGRRMRLDARLAASNLDVAALPVPWPGPRPPAGPYSLKLRARGGLDDLAVSGVVLQGAGLLRFNGSGDLTAMRWSLDTVLKNLDLAAWGLSPTPVSFSGNAKLQAQGLPTRPGSTLKAELSLQGLAAAGHQLGALQAKAELAGASLQVPSLGLTGPLGEVSGQASASLGEQPTLKAALEFKGLRPPIEYTGPLQRPEFNGSLKVDGPWSKLAVDLALASSTVTQGAKLSSLTAKGVVLSGRPELHGLTLAARSLKLSATGRATLDDCDLAFDLTAGDLAGLAAELGSAGIAPPAGLGGSARAKGSLKGPWPKLTLAVDLGADELTVADYSAGKVRIRADLKGLGTNPVGTLKLTAEEVVAFAEDWASLEVSLKGDGRGITSRLSADGEDRRLAFTLRLDRANAWPLTGRLSGLDYLHRGQGRWQQQGAAELALRPDGGRVKGLSLVNGVQAVKLDGELAPGGKVGGEFEVRRILLAPYLGQAAVPPDARIDGSAVLGGTLGAPVLKVEGVVDGLKLKGLPASRARLSGSYAEGVLKLKGDIHTGGLTTMGLEGTLAMGLKLVPPWLPSGFGAMNFKVYSRELPLTLLEPLIPGVRGLGGQLNLAMNVTGTLDSPRINGAATLDKGSFTLASTGQAFTGIKARIRADGRTITVDQFTTAGGEAKVSLTGSYTLADGDEGKADLHLVTKRLNVSLGSLGNIVADGDLVLKGTARAPRLSGLITPRGATLRLGLGAPEGLQDVVFLKPGQKPPAMERGPKVVEPPAFIAPMAIQLMMAIDGNLRVNIDQGWMDVSGRIEMKKDPGGPIIFSRGLKIRQGLVFYEARAFNITGGQVLFGGKPQIDPELKDLKASLDLGKTKVQVVMNGPASDPNIQFTSQPPMSQSDIISTIVFGQPAATLNQEQYETLSAQAMALLGFKGRSELERIFGRNLTPDVVTVGRGYDVGSFLEAGKYLSDNLYLRYRKSAQTDGGQNVGVEYRFSPYFSIESQMGTTRDTGVDLTFTFDF